MARKSDNDIFYSLLNLTNGNILSARLHDVNYWMAKEKEIHTRTRNWKLSQFDLGGTEILEDFINDVPMHNRYSMGVHEVWVREEDIDQLYAILAISTLRNFCGWEKQKCLFGAFVWQKGTELFMSEDWTSRSNYPEMLLRTKNWGKDFLTFLQTYGVLSYRIFPNRSMPTTEKRTNFSLEEIELITKKRSEIITVFEYSVKK